MKLNSHEIKEEMKWWITFTLFDFSIIKCNLISWQNICFEVTSSIICDWEGWNYWIWNSLNNQNRILLEMSLKSSRTLIIQNVFETYSFGLHLDQLNLVGRNVPLKDGNLSVQNDWSNWEAIQEVKDCKSFRKGNQEASFSCETSSHSSNSLKPKKTFGSFIIQMILLIYIVSFKILLNLLEKSFLTNEEVSNKHLFSKNVFNSEIQFWWKQ
jgi:hypothetical protein